MNSTITLNSNTRLANPFCFATVVVADEYVDTFPHPEGLLTYLHRLFEQLEVDIVSLERPVTVKGSWKTIIKIDAFLKTLMSTLHSAILKGAVPSEEDFSSVFTHFEAENDLRTEPVEKKERTCTLHTEICEAVHSPPESGEETVQPVEETNEVESTGYRSAQLLENENNDFDLNTHNKWYFNSNPRGKTVDKSRKRYLGLKKAPPEPFVFVGGDVTNKVNPPNLTEIEKALCKVYKKETIQKYQKKSFGCDKAKENENNSDSEDLGTCKVEMEDLKVKTSGTDHMLSSSSNNVKPRLSHCNQDPLKNNVENGDLFSDGIKTSNEKKKRIKGNSESLHPVTVQRNDTGVEELDKNVDSLPVKRKQPTRKVVSNRGNASSEGGSDVPEKSIVKEKGWQRKIQRDTIKKDAMHIKGKNYSKRKKKKTQSSGADIEPPKIKMDGGSQKVNENDGKDKITRKRSRNQKELIDTAHECNQCSYTTSKHMQLEEHMRRVHLTKRYQCGECLKEFGYQKDLKRHLKCHTKAENCCDVCGKMYKEVRKLIEHKKIHADNYVKPEFPCNFCTKSFSTKYVLAYHIKSEHLGMKRSYICPTCGKSFSQKNSYLLHANVHLGIKPFTCEICGKCFSYEKSLKEHKFMHKDDKVFSCKVCGKSFRQASGLTIHLKVHKPTKDYVCSMCGKGFSQKQALVRHERIHAGEKPYECGLCKRTFADSSVLRRHMILIHKKDPKEWRQDTLNHTPKKTDFFISVLDGSEKGKSNSRDTGSENQIIQTQDKQQPEKCEKVLHSHEDNTEHQTQQKLQSEQQGQQHNQSSDVEMSIPTSIEHFKTKPVAVTKEKTSFTEIKDPGETAKCVKTTFSNKKICIGLSDTSINVSSDPCLSEQQIEPSVFSEPLQIHHQNVHNAASLSLPNLPATAHSLEALTVHASPLPGQIETQTPAVEENTATFLPVTYQPRPFSYNANNNLQTAEIQQVQYTTYGQTIVVLPENLGAIFHQPNVSVGLSGDTTQESLQLQSINQSPMSPLNSSPIPHLVDLSQVVSSTPSSFDRVMPDDREEQDRSV